MPRLVLVHGIKQEGKNPDHLEREWVEGLSRLAGSLAGGSPSDVDWLRPENVDMPFYGDLLAAHTDGATKPETTAMGGGQAGDLQLAMARAYAEELKVRAGITEAQIAAAEAADPAAAGGAGEIVVEQGSIVHNRRVKAIIRAVEAISPFQGRIALRLLAQAHVYLTRGNVAEEVDAIVRPFLEQDEELVVVAHSLGSIVTYRILREMALAGTPARVKLYMTLGSPLGIKAVKNSLGPAFAKPGGVEHWANGGDKDDFVALHPKLAGIYGGGVEDLSPIRNGDADKHAIVDYLDNRCVHAPILRAFGLDPDPLP